MIARSVRLLLFTIGLSGPSILASPATDLHAALVASLEDTQKCSAVFREGIAAFTDADKTELYQLLATEQSKRLAAYEKAYTTAAKIHFRSHLTPERKAQTATHIARIKELAGGGLNSTAIAQEIYPIFEELDQIFLVDAAAIASTTPSLKGARAKMENLVLAAGWARDEIDSSPRALARPILEAEYFAVTAAVPMSDLAAQTFATNRRQASELPLESAKGIRYLNFIRTLCGKEPFRLSMRHQEFAMWHVYDMIEKDYYAPHPSPPDSAPPHLQSLRWNSAGLGKDIADPLTIARSYMTTSYLLGVVLDTSHRYIGLGYHEQRWSLLIAQ